jgi:hypothetical protein
MPLVLNTSGGDFEDAMHLESGPESTLPFNMKPDQQQEALIIHMKVLTSDLKEIEAANVALNKAVRGQRINGKDVCIIVTDESVSLNIADARALAAHITPTIMRNLGLSSIR